MPGYEVRELIKEVDKDMNGTIEFDEFILVRILIDRNVYLLRICLLSFGTHHWICIESSHDLVLAFLSHMVQQ